MVLAIGIPGSILYSHNNDSDEWMEAKDSPFTATLSIGSQGNDAKDFNHSYLYIMIGLNSVVIAIIYAVNSYFRYYYTTTAHKIDIRRQSQNKFTVRISNLPSKRSQEEIETWLKTAAPEAKVVNFSFEYRVREEVEAISRIQKLVERKDANNDAEISTLNDNVTGVIDNINRRDSDFTKDHYTRAAYVTFEQS